MTAVVVPRRAALRVTPRPTVPAAPRLGPAPAPVAHRLVRHQRQAVNAPDRNADLAPEARARKKIKTKKKKKRKKTLAKRLKKGSQLLHQTRKLKGGHDRPLIGVNEGSVRLRLVLQRYI